MVLMVCTATKTLQGTAVSIRIEEISELLAFRGLICRKFIK